MGLPLLTSLCNPREESSKGAEFSGHWVGRDVRYWQGVSYLIRGVRLNWPSTPTQTHNARSAPAKTLLRYTILKVDNERRKKCPLIPSAPSKPRLPSLICKWDSPWTKLALFCHLTGARVKLLLFLTIINHVPSTSTSTSASFWRASSTAIRWTVSANV